MTQAKNVKQKKRWPEVKNVGLLMVEGRCKRSDSPNIESVV
jgi:hypothetical protein